MMYHDRMLRPNVRAWSDLEEMTTKQKGRPDVARVSAAMSQAADEASRAPDEAQTEATQAEPSDLPALAVPDWVFVA